MTDLAPNPRDSDQPDFRRPDFRRPDFQRLGTESFVALSTFRRNGEAVPTPVWVAADGPALVVITPADSGKVKRLRNDPSVHLQPCSRRGSVPENAPVVSGHAEIVVDGAETERLTGVIRRKYGVEYRIVMFVERILARRQKPRVILRILPA